MSYTLYIESDHVASPIGKSARIQDARAKAYRTAVREFKGGWWAKKMRISIVDDAKIHGDSYEIGNVSINVQGVVIYKSWDKKKYRLNRDGSLNPIGPKTEYGIKGKLKPFGL